MTMEIATTPRSTSRWRSMLFCALYALALLHAGPAQAAPPALMLATTWESGPDVRDYWISEKLDGVRGHWDGRQLLTRGGYRVHAPDGYTDGWPDIPMDGELWIERGHFEMVSGIVRSSTASDADWEQVRFMVFDLPAHPGTFDARVAAMRALLPPLDIAWLQAIPQFRVDDEVELQDRLDAVIAADGEGLMLHHRDARYRAGRSTQLLKLKPWDDDEARVVGHLPGQGKYEDMLGALVVERPDGLRFRLGTGFTDAQRADPPPLGARVTYRYNGHTANGVPRFARFLRVRDEGD